MRIPLGRLLLAGGTALLAIVSWYRSAEVGSEHLLPPATQTESSPPVATEKAPVFFEQFIHEPAEGTIRHVSSVASLGNGRMIAAWYEGSREGARDVAVHLAEYDPETRAWSGSRVVVDRASSSRELGRYVKKVGNALLMKGGDGKLWLFYSTVAAGGWSGTSVNYKISPDGGRSWSRSEKLLLSPLFNLTHNIKNKGLLLSDGSFLLPVYHEFLRKYSGFVRVTERGGTVIFEIHKIASGAEEAIQPAFVPEGTRGIVALFRSMRSAESRYVLRAESGDLGRHWSALSATTIPHPNAGIDAVRLSTGEYLIAANDSFSGRNRLSLLLSGDRGYSWRVLRVLEERQEGEYSYPFIARGEDGLYHVTYTFERRQIKHVVFNEEWATGMRRQGD